MGESNTQEPIVSLQTVDLFQMLRELDLCSSSSKANH